MWKYKAERITSSEWENRISEMPDEFESKCRFLRNLIPGGVKYLFSPYEYSCRGDMLLRRLKFDSSPEALRLWAFLFSEKDRLFLAKENGWKIIAAMKDLGQVPVLTYAFPETITFYADELWWAPCFSEESHLLDEAARLGAGEELCFIRAALGAMVTLDYFPKPDLCIAGVGSCCDDFSAVMQLIESLGYPVHWWEMAARFDEPLFSATETRNRTTYGGSEYQSSALGFLKGQLETVVARMEELTGKIATPSMLTGSLNIFNRLRGGVRELRDLVYSAEKPPLPGLEMYLAEFTAIHTCSEPEESLNVIEELLSLTRRRIDKGESPFDDKPVRVFWVTPPTDAALITLLEDLGGCIAGTEYLISHAFMPLSTKLDPITAVAENCLDDPMIGSPSFRARRIIDGARKYGAEGIVVSGIFGASHCPWEEGSIKRMIEQELKIPVLCFDVPFSPGRVSEQVSNRLQGFMELLRSKRKSSVSISFQSINKSIHDSADPFQYFRESMSHEVDTARALKRQGRKIVGIYCEFTPRDLILAAGAYPVCLCGASRRTIPAAETILPSNLCPLIKSSFGYIITSRCPFFIVSDLIVAETTCDGKKKMYELIADRKPQHILELTQKVDEDDAFRHWHSEVKKLRTHLEESFDIRITDYDLRKSIKNMNRERLLLQQALFLGRFDPPIVTGMELAMLRYRISGLEDHMRMLDLFTSEVMKRKDEGRFIKPPGTPRILLTGCPMSNGTLKVIEIIEKAGGVVVAQETCSGLKPIDSLVSEEGDPLESIARKHFNIPCSCMTPNTGRIDLLGRMIDTFSADAVVDLVWHACHTYSIESWQIEKFVKNEKGLPFLKIETDYSESDRERLSVRLQTLLEMI